MTLRTCTIVLLSVALLCTLADAIYMPSHDFTLLCERQSRVVNVPKAAYMWLHSSQDHCRVRVRFAAGLLVTVESLNLTSSPNCTKNYLRLTTASNVTVGGPFCGHQVDYHEVTPALQVTFFAPPDNSPIVLDVNATPLGSRFFLVLTPFTNVSSDGSCPEFKRHCVNKRCVASEIFCDGHNRCGGTHAPLPGQCPRPVDIETSLWAIGTITFGVVSLLVVFACCVWSARQRGQIEVTPLGMPSAICISSNNGGDNGAAASDTADTSPTQEAPATADTSHTQEAPATADTSPTQQAPSVNDAPSVDHQLSVECTPTTSDKARFVTS
ncbi:uncharacterized protein LOC144109917 isoform X2 [Amblyomma americanum]